MDSSVRAALVLAAILVVTQFGAIFMISSVLMSQAPAFENPNDPLIPVYYAVGIVLFTFAILYIIKKKKENFVRIIFLAAVTFTIFYVFLAVFVAGGLGDLGLLLAIALTCVLGYYLVKRPEWYVIDAAGIIMAVGIIGIFGRSLDILPAMIMLIILAVYDAVSVYGTKHMVALADGVTQLRLPILLVIPKVRGYSYLDQKPLKEQLDDGSEREAMFMGLGDLIIPGVLVASAFTFLSDELVLGIPGNVLVALGALIGILAGYGILMRYVLKGNPQAGLPLLNGGAIAGYLISYVLVYGEYSMGIVLPW